jgi:hypothetical protein
MPITTTPSGSQGEFSTYTPIYSQTISSNTTSITFSNIPTTYTDLVLVVTPVAGTGTTFPWMRFNGVTASIYSDTHLYGISSGNGSSRRTAQTRGYIAEQVEAGTTQISNTIVHIMNYSNTTANKTYIARNNNGASSGTYVGTEVIAGLAQLTAPITSITIGIASGGSDYNLASGSTFILYGIKAAETQFIPVNASGGDYAVSDGTYAYHVFKSSGIFAAAKSLAVEYLVIAGGGGGGVSRGGGGGAGGYRTGSATISTAIAVTVGAGGAGGTGADRGVNGTTSSFNSLNTSGGGGGGGGAVGAATGGSGGGGFYEATAGAAGNSGSYSPVEGYAGANGAGLTYGSVGNLPAGGGGGAGGIAPALTGNTNAGVGGPGSSANSTWLSATRTGVNGFIAGGGGGAALNAGGFQAIGGVGGGGAASSAANTAGSQGTSNTGSGGGGGYGGSGGIGDAPGGAGGSGIVIVRYALNA